MVVVSDPEPRRVEPRNTRKTRKKSRKKKWRGKAQKQDCNSDSVDLVYSFLLFFRDFRVFRGSPAFRITSSTPPACAVPRRL